MHRSMMALATATLLALSAPTAFAMTYGAPMPEGDAMPVTGLIANADAHRGHTMTFSGRITSVCQKTGCWVMLDANGTGIRVRTKHEFFLPKDASGSALVHGRLEPVEPSAEHAAHRAADGSADAKPGREWQIIASSVVIES